MESPARIDLFDTAGSVLDLHGSSAEEPRGMRARRQVDIDRHGFGNVWRRRTFDEGIAHLRLPATDGARRRGVHNRTQLIRAPR